METDDNKNSGSDEKEDIDISQFESKLQFEHIDMKSSMNQSPSSPSSSSKHKKKRRKSNKNPNDINAILKQNPIKKSNKKVEVPSLTRICLELMYSNIIQYESFDFLPQDLAAELLVMVVDRGHLNRETVRPFLNTKHELIKEFCKKKIDISRLPPIYNYDCRGY